MSQAKRQAGKVKKLPEQFIEKSSFLQIPRDSATQLNSCEEMMMDLEKKGTGVYVAFGQKNLLEKKV